MDIGVDDQNESMMIMITVFLEWKRAAGVMNDGPKCWLMIKEMYGRVYC